MATVNRGARALPRGPRKGWPVIYPGKGEKPTTITLTDHATALADGLVEELEITKSEIVEFLIRNMTPDQRAALLHLRELRVEQARAAAPAGA